VAAVECLETRQLLSMSFNPVLLNQLPAGKSTLFAVSVNGQDTAQAVNYAVTTNSPDVQAEMLQGTTSWRIRVKDTTPGTPGFDDYLTFQLFDSVAPKAADRIRQLSTPDSQGNYFYLNKLIHRVEDAVIQGGSLNGNGTGGTGAPLSAEFAPWLTYNSQGLLAWADGGQDTADSQFFITRVDPNDQKFQSGWNFRYGIFGIMTGGFETLKKIAALPTFQSGQIRVPNYKPLITSAEVFTDNQTAVLKVTPKSTFTGAVNATVTANNGSQNSISQPLNLTVVGDNNDDPPWLGPVTNQTAIQGRPVSFQVQGFDLENDPLTFVVKDGVTWAAPTKVAVQISQTPAQNGNPAVATVTLIPDVDFSGTVNLRMGVRQSNNAVDSDQSNNEAFVLTVNPVNHAPTAPGGTSTTLVNTSVNFTLPGNDGDPDKTQVLAFTKVAGPSNGTLTITNPATGAATYQPNPGYIGTDSFTYQIKDDGGVANNGADTSTVATYTIQVGSVSASGLTLAASSDTGSSSTDRVTSDDTPTFNVNAPTGASVVLRVNDRVNVPMTETGSGTGIFTATLTRDQVRVGANQVVATATSGGQASAPTTPLEFVLTADYLQLYTVVGDAGTQQATTFQWIDRNAALSSEFGWFVADATGAVGGVAPGAANYARTALAHSSRTVVFGRGTAEGTTRTQNLTGGARVVFYLAVGVSADEVVSGSSRGEVYFSMNAANPDRLDHVHTQSDPRTGQVLLSWEDMRGGGDRDYNDAVIGVTPGTTPAVLANQPLRLNSGNGQTTPLSVTLRAGEGGAAKSTANGEIGLYFVSNAGGTVNGIAPGAAGYAQAVLSSATRKVVFQQGDTIGTSKTLTLNGGELVGWYYIPAGTAAQVLSANAANSADVSPRAYFSFDAANPGGGENFRWYGREGNGVERSEAEGAGPLTLHLAGGLTPRLNSQSDYRLQISQPG
jgi:cyclophilin family peptidyl-prolyl cis-trans isomerase